MNKREFRERQQRFQASRKAEMEFARHLRSVASQIDSIVRGLFNPSTPNSTHDLREALKRYAEIIKPWAKTVVQRMHADVGRRDKAMWKKLADEIGVSLSEELSEGKLGVVVRKALDDQVNLITSLPLEAAQRVHELTLKGLESGARAKEIADEIMKTGQVTKSRAMLIARTETARTAAEVTKARALDVGCTHYIWRTSGDSDVRKSHKEMNGKVVAYDKPPEVEPGKFYHAGTFPNCRCYQEPLLPETD